MWACGTHAGIGRMVGTLPWQMGRSILYHNRMTSLRARLFGVWVLSLAGSLTVGLLLVQLYRQSSAAQISRADAELQSACGRIADRYAYYLSGWTEDGVPPGDAPFQHDLDAAATLALAPSPGIVGGILRSPADIRPASPQSLLASEALAGSGTSRDETAIGPRTIISLACRLPGPLPDVAAWVATAVDAPPGAGALQIGLGVLLALMLGLSAALAWLVSSWSRQIGRVEEALAGHTEPGLPQIAPTGEAELDRIAQALNRAGQRLREAQQAEQSASARAALAERMAAIGRIAAGVAHEIRNPLAAMRLRAEGALAMDPQLATGRGRASLAAIIVQIDRLDRLSGELLTMTQRRTPVVADVDITAFLADCATTWDSPGLIISAPQGTARIDAGMIRQALDNLVQNARRHAADGGTVAVRVQKTEHMLHIEVEDDGPGIPESLRETLFEPFVTGRADGTGLGLSIAREMVQAHGGQLALARAEGGTLFTVDLPQEPPP